MSLPTTTILNPPSVNSNNNSVPTTRWVKDITSGIKKTIEDLTDATTQNAKIVFPYSVAEQTRINDSVSAVDSKFASYEQTSSITTKLALKQNTIENLDTKRLPKTQRD